MKNRVAIFLFTNVLYNDFACVKRSLIFNLDIKCLSVHKVACPVMHLRSVLVNFLIIVI